MPFLLSFKHELSLLFVNSRICYLILLFSGALMGHLFIAVGGVSVPVGLASPLLDSPIVQP